MKPIHSLLSSLAIIPEERAWHRTLICDWVTIMGNLHTKVHLEKIDGDTLILGVYDACWMHELYLMSPLLIKTINQKLDGAYIKQVRFKKLGKRPVVKKMVMQKAADFSREPIDLSSREKAALKEIPDTQLQEALRKFLIRCYREK